MQTENSHQNVCVAGSTGYLGKHIVQELLQRNMAFTAIARSAEKLPSLDPSQIQLAEVTQPKSLEGIFNTTHTVISTVGITRQKDNLTYMDVDYQANIHLLREAEKARVKKFIYISAINGDQMRNLKIFEAKEAFVDALKNSSLDYTIIRPNGFFSDMRDFLQMAQHGRVYLFGKGEYKLNPIHGADLARFVVDAISNSEKELTIGGPDIFTQNQLAQLALESCHKAERITHLPDFTRKALIKSLKTFTSSKTYGPYEFFLTAMGQDNVAPTYGQFHLKDFFEQEAQKLAQQQK